MQIFKNKQSKSLTRQELLNLITNSQEKENRRSSQPKFSIIQYATPELSIDIPPSKNNSGQYPSSINNIPSKTTSVWSNNRQDLNLRKMAVQISQLTQQFQDFQTQQIQSKRTTKSVLDFGELDSQMQQFNSEKKGLIELYKKKISSLESKYESKCKEVERINKEIVLQNTILTQQDVVQTERISRDRKDWTNSNIDLNMRDPLKKERADLLLYEFQLKDMAFRLKEQERTIEQRNRDTMKIQLQINNARKEQENMQKKLNAREICISEREMELEAKHNELNILIGNLKDHHKNLFDVGDRLEHRVDNLKEYDLNLMRIIEVSKQMEYDESLI